MTTDRTLGAFVAVLAALLVLFAVAITDPVEPVTENVERAP